jgi:RNA binding exosome subunit
VSQDLRISFVRISVHAHPTEIVDKVKQAVANLIPVDVAGLDEILETTILEGDYGNKIHVMNVTLKSAKQVAGFMQYLKEHIPDDHKQLIRQHFDSLYNPDNKTLYLRFHKQLAFQGQLRISQYDDILHASIKFTAYTRQAVGNEQGTNILKFLLDQGIIA